MGLYSKFFFHNSTRRYVIAIGNLLDNIFIVREDDDGVEHSREKVPVSYSPKQKFFYRNEQDKDFNLPISNTWPRIGYEITGFEYAPERHTFSTRKISITDPTDPQKKRYQYNAVPYDIAVTVYIGGKSQEEVHQIVEQIVPFFSPSYPLSVKIIPEMNVSLVTPITLISKAPDDDFDAPFDQYRHLTMTLEFTLQGFFFGPTRSSKIIKTAITNIRPISDDPEADKNATITVQPYSDTIPLAELTQEDDYGYLTTITEYINPIEQHP